MHQIDGPYTVETMPAPRPVGTPGWFGPGDPAAGLLSTRVTYEFLNAVMAELLAILAAAGISPNKTNNAQVLEAMRALAIPLWDETLYCTPPVVAAPAIKGVSQVFGSDGRLWISTVPSGPGTAAGPKDPVTTTGYWQFVPGQADLTSKVNYSDFTQNLTASGWQKLPSGLIIQWGMTTTLATGTNQLITLPVAFPVITLLALGTPYVTAPTAVTDYGVVTGDGSGNNKKTHIRVYNTASTGSFPISWLAIGY